MLSRKFGLSRPTILVWMLLSISIGCAKGDQMPVLSDEQVVERLASRTPQEADAAVGEIMRDGARLTGLLLKHRGNRQPFAGTSLFNPRASILLPIPTEGFEIPESQKYRVITAEVAALYLISAIQRGQLHFSQAPLLLDPAEPQGSRVIANTPERVARAFDAAERWFRTDATARQSGDPIATSGFRWY